MSGLPQKARFRCPGCGFFQLEPPGLISTFCQSCGEHYGVRIAPTAPTAPTISLSNRAVLCYRCGKSHPVSPHAANTICPGCNSAIELGDMTVLTPTSRQVDIRGRLVIGPAGSLSSSWIVCGAADIEGRIAGVLRSEGEVCLGARGVCACRMTAPAVVIDKKARMSLTLPLETGHLEVRGHLKGTVHCRGIVHVRRGGRLEAEVYARAVKVDKGGALFGTCHVDGTQPAEPGKQIPSYRLDTLWPEHLCPAC